MSLKYHSAVLMLQHLPMRTIMMVNIQWEGNDRIDSNPHELGRNIYCEKTIACDKIGGLMPA
jgi:hypothetical protein